MYGKEVSTRDAIALTESLGGSRDDDIRELSEDRRRTQRWLDEIMAARRFRASLEAEDYLRSLGVLRRHVRWLTNQVTILVCGTAFAIAVAWALGGFRG